MATFRPRSLVFCADHDGHQAFFMMHSDDFRIATAEAAQRGHYVILDTRPRYIHKERLLDSSCGWFQVASDWSLRPVDRVAEATAARLQAQHARA